MSGKQSQEIPKINSKTILNFANPEKFLKEYEKGLLKVKSVKQFKLLKIPNQHKYVGITKKTRYFVEMFDKTHICFATPDSMSDFFKNEYLFFCDNFSSLIACNKRRLAMLISRIQSRKPFLKRGEPLIEDAFKKVKELMKLKLLLIL